MPHIGYRPNNSAFDPRLQRAVVFCDGAVITCGLRGEVDVAEELMRRINEILGRPAKEAIRISEFQLAFHDFRRNTIDPLIQAAQRQLDEHGIKAVAHSDVEGSLLLLGDQREGLSYIWWHFVEGEAKVEAHFRSGHGWSRSFGTMAEVESELSQEKVIDSIVCTVETHQRELPRGLSRGEAE